MMQFVPNINKKHFWYVAAGMLIYCFFLLVHLPANLVITKMLPRTLSANIKYNAIAGSIWSGKFTDLSVKQVGLGNVSWELSALPLVWGNADVSFNAHRENIQLSGDASIGSAKLELDDVEINYPISDLMPLLYGLPLSIDGNIRGHFENLFVEPGSQLSIKGRAVLSNMRLVAPQVLELGSLVMQFEPEQDGTRIVINDQQGPVTVDAIVTINANGRYTVKSTLVPQPSADNAIKNSLAMMIGAPDNRGRYTFNYSGAIPLRH
jgi:hypothetical protein